MKAREQKRTHAKGKAIENVVNNFYPKVNEIRLGLKQRAKAKRFTFCNRYNTKGYPCKDGHCKFSPCFEWADLLKTDILSGTVYDDPMFMPKGQGKPQVPSVEDKENPYNN